MIIEIADLSLSVKGKPIIHPFSLTIESGEIVGLVGRNGSGKTSLLRCVAGLIPAFNGKILYNGRERGNDFKKVIGVLIDGNSLYTNLTAKQNLDIIRRYYNLPREIIDETLNLVGLIESADKQVRHFSSGMKQRLSIGIAFINRPSLIILDEPLNTLDPEAVVGIRNLIETIKSRYKTTFIISSHSLEELNKLFDRLLILNKGWLIFNESKEKCEALQLAQVELSANKADEVTTLVQRLNLLYQIEGQQIFVIGNLESLSRLKTETQGHWSENRKPSIEEVYLYAHTTYPKNQ